MAKAVWWFVPPISSWSNGLLLAGALACLTSCRGDVRAPAAHRSGDPSPTVVSPTNSLPGEIPADSAIPAEARSIHDRLAEELPADPGALLARGRVLEIFGESSLAEVCWQACLNQKPDLALAHEMLGMIAVKRGDFDAAVEHLRQAGELDPQHPELKLQLGKALLAAGRCQEAVVAFEQQLAGQPTSSEAWFRLGQAHYRLQDFRRAKDCYESSIQSDPERPLPWYGLAQVCRRLNEPEQERECLQRFEELEREARAKEAQLRESFDSQQATQQAVAHAYCIAADAWMQADRPDDALADWQKAAALDPANVECRQALSAALSRQQGQEQAALDQLQELRKLQPQRLEHLFEAARLHERLKQFAEAEACWKQAEQLAPGNPDIQASLVSLYLATARKLPEAETLAEQLVRQHPTADHFFLLSTVRLARGNRAGAGVALQEALRLEPENARFRQAAQILAQERK
jgi:tetratricopeptide (TPR) repeat protein